MDHRNIHTFCWVEIPNLHTVSYSIVNLYYFSK